MAVAFVFPGQGSQAVGMGRSLFEEFASSRAVFEEVDEALGEKLSTLLFEGPIERLTLTENAQPALMAVSVAAMRALQAEGFDPTGIDFVAGHSLGEYSALAAVGSLQLADAARLLRLRGLSMQEAVPAGKGAMAAIIGLDPDAVAAICEEAAGDGVCDLANDNGGGQLVVSGDVAAVERAMALASERGAKRAIALPVSAPFHCRLMQPAAERMAEALSDVLIAAPAMPIVSNVTASPTNDPETIRERLVSQVTGRVRWRESIEWLAAHGVARQVEIGSGKVLSGLVRRIERGIETRTVGTADEVRAFADPAA